MSKMVKKSKKIEVIVKYFYPVAAGIETNILETYSVLVEQGWDVVVHTSNLDYTTGEILSEEENIRGIKVRRYPLGKFGFFPKGFVNSDIVALHNFDIFPHLWILLRSLFMKIIERKKYALTLTPHGGFNPEWRVFSKLEALVKSSYHFTVGTLLINSVVDGVRAVSEWEREEMVKKGIRSGKVRVISNGIEDVALADIDKLASKSIKKEVVKMGRYLIQVGRVYPIKNYETTIKALPHIPKDIKFLIAGPVADQKYLKKLKNLSKKLNVSDRVLFYGVVRGADKFYLMKRALAMVHMAIWESFCNVVHEGMSQGLPVIVANNTALPFLVKDGKNGYLVGTQDHEKVAERINFVVKNKNSDEIEEMIAANRAFGKEHAWRRVAEKMGNFYLELIK